MDGGGQPPRFGDGIGHGGLLVALMLTLMVLPRGSEPRSSGYQPGALPLSYGRGDGASLRARTAGPLYVAQVLLVAKPTKRMWGSLQDSNLGMSVSRTDALAAWRSERMLVHPGGLEPPCLGGGRF